MVPHPNRNEAGIVCALNFDDRVVADKQGRTGLGLNFFKRELNTSASIRL